MINSYLNSASHNQGSINTTHSSQDKGTSLDEDDSPSPSESESLPHDVLSLLSNPAPPVVSKLYQLYLCLYFHELIEKFASISRLFLSSALLAIRCN
jgi:hypothetical protein